MAEKVLVLGAGTGGLVAANLLAAHGYSVTLVEKSGRHLFQPGMLWIAFKGHPPGRYTRPVESLVRRGVNLVRGRVESIDLADRRVRLEGGKELGYDWLIIALGASLDYSSIPGHEELHREFGDYFSNEQDAAKLWSHFSRLEEGTLVIAAADPLYKCPPAPHKAAFLASDTLARTGRKGKVKVVLALPFLHAYPSKTMADIVGPELEKAGIELVTMFTVDSIDTENRVIRSLEGGEISYSIATVIPIHKGPRVSVNPESAVDGDGFFKVDKYTLRLLEYDDAFAIGDCSNAPTSKTGVTAHIGAEVVVDRILGYDSRFTGRTNCPIVADGTAAFVISDYDHPPVPVKFSKLKRVMEDLFIAAYWSSLKYPERWGPFFRAYFDATSPGRLGMRGW